MKISANGAQLSIYFDKSKKNLNLIPIFLLHGFTGNSSDWDFFTSKLSGKFFPIAVDIIGHGKSDSPKEKEYYNEENLVKQLHSIIQYLGLEKIILLGYSLGGRIALSYSLKYSGYVRGLILEGASPGIENEDEKELRLVNDKIIADTILQNGIEYFINSWINQPFFNSLKNIGDEKLSKIIAERMGNNHVGLSNILTEFSQGKMNSKWEILKNLSIPTLLISGELDKKYCEINKRIGEKTKNSQVKIVKACGHNVHLEKEEEFINLVNSFLEKYF